MLSDTLSDVVDTLAEAEEDYVEHYSPKIMERVKFHTDCLHQLRRELDNPNEPEDTAIEKYLHGLQARLTMAIWVGVACGGAITGIIMREFL